MKKLMIIAVLTAVAIFGVLAYANAATDAITISATVNSRIVVTAPADHDFGLVEPDAGVQTYSGNVNVRSNVPFTLAVGEAGDAAGAFSTTSAGMDGTTSYPKAPAAAGRDFPENWSFDPAPGGVWLDGGAYSAAYTYTALP